MSALSAFLAPQPPLSPLVADLCLPEFNGTLESPLGVLDSHGDATYGYPSVAFANRDVKSAFYVQSLLTQHFDQSSIHVLSPQDFLNANVSADPTRLGVLIGSRSNSALAKAANAANLERLVKFEFGPTWSIVGQDGRRFSISDPSKLSREHYESLTDYCVIARIQSSGGGPLFVIAGLGGRATEGGGRYFAQSWASLHQRFGARDFAVVLKFAPPVDPAVCEPAALYELP
jgi:hypothetical protein